MFTLRGKVIVISAEQIISEKFKKREFVIEDDSSQYPQVISFQVVQDNCNILDSFSVGDEVEVNFNIKGREWTSPKDGQVKYFNTLEAWRINPTGAASPNVTVPDMAKTDGADDLPF